MKFESKQKLPNKKVITSAEFDAKEQLTKSALEKLNHRMKELLIY